MGGSGTLPTRHRGGGVHARAKDWQNHSQPSYNRRHHDEYEQNNVARPKQKREPPPKKDWGEQAEQQQLQHRMPRAESGRGAGETVKKAQRNLETTAEKKESRPKIGHKVLSSNAH